MFCKCSAIKKEVILESSVHRVRVGLRGLADAVDALLRLGVVPLVPLRLKLDQVNGGGQVNADPDKLGCG